MEELGIGRPSTYAVDAERAARPRIRADGPETARARRQGPARHRIPVVVLRPLRAVRLSLPSLEESSTSSRTESLTGRRCCAISGGNSRQPSARPRNCAFPNVLEALNEILGPAIFPPKEDGSDPRGCPACSAGRLSLKTGKFGAFIGCSNYPECRFTRQFSETGDDGAAPPSARKASCWVKTRQPASP
jgi:DNA topoisomerase-1